MVRAMIEVFGMAGGPLQGLVERNARFSLWRWTGEDVAPDPKGTHYGVVTDGDVELDCSLNGSSHRFRLSRDMVFCVPGRLALNGVGSVVGITHADAARGFFRIAGPIEAEGRLRYIDGCTDSLVVAPQRRGDPCLNHLHFPSGIHQTAHTHPSFRAGVVLRGRGHCDGELGRLPLESGNTFHIPANTPHRFLTTDSTMDIVAFHPDSDYGPTHDDHPMINRTLVDGVSARHLKSIRT